jgi:hypothetical protein
MDKLLDWIAAALLIVGLLGISLGIFIQIIR